MIIQVNSPQIGTPLQVSSTPATPVIQTQNSQQLAPGSTTIAAGAYFVEIFNTGLYPITANGQTIEPNDSLLFEERMNHTINRQDFTPAVAVVVPADGKGYYTEYRPS